MFGLFLFWNLISKMSNQDSFLLEFSGFYILFNLWFSRFFVVVCLSSNSFSISDVVLFVNNFFYLFFWTFWRFMPRSHGASIIIANVELNVNNFSKLSTKSDNFIISSQNRHSIILLCKPDFFPTFLWIMWITSCITQFFLFFRFCIVDNFFANQRIFRHSM